MSIRKNAHRVSYTVDAKQQRSVSAKHQSTLQSEISLNRVYPRDALSHSSVSDINVSYTAKETSVPNLSYTARDSSAMNVSYTTKESSAPFKHIKPNQSTTLSKETKSRNAATV